MRPLGSDNRGTVRVTADLRLNVWPCEEAIEMTTADVRDGSVHSTGDDSARV